MNRKNNEVSNYVPEMTVTGKCDGQFLRRASYDLQAGSGTSRHDYKN